MNLPLLACLLLSTLSVALSFTALVLVLRRPRRQTQTSGHNSVQFQSGGSLHLDETSDHRAERIARDVSLKMGRHL